MSASNRPVVVVAMQREDDLRRFETAVAGVGEVYCAETLEDAKDLVKRVQPDICLVDIECSTPSKEPFIVVLRGLFASAEFIGIGSSPSLGSLIASVNEGKMRRFVDRSSSDAEISEAVQGVWLSGRSMKVLRHQLRGLMEERDALQQERDRLSSNLASSNEQLQAATVMQQEERNRMHELLAQERVASNVLDLGEFRSRVSGEVERFKRYAHPVSLLVLRVDFAVSDEASLQNLRIDALRVVSGEVRLIDLLAVKDQSSIVVLLPVTDRNRASVAATRIRSALERPLLKARVGKTEIYSYPSDEIVFRQYQ